MSLHCANETDLEAQTYFANALLANIVMSCFYLLIGFFFFEPIAYFLGTTSETIKYVKNYGIFFILGIPFFMFSSFLQTFIRNDHAPKLSMAAVISGGVINIILDYIFVFHFSWGMTGASLATLLGSFISCLILITHFFSHTNGLHFVFHGVSLYKLKLIFMNGLSSFFIELANGILSFLFNIQLLRYIGVIGVTVYSIIANTAIILMSLCNGVAQVARPIITLNFGVKQFERIKVLVLQPFGI